MQLRNVQLSPRLMRVSGFLRLEPIDGKSAWWLSQVSDDRLTGDGYWKPGGVVLPDHFVRIGRVSSFNVAVRHPVSAGK